MLRPIADVAQDLGLDSEHVLPYGRAKAKIDLQAMEGRERKAKLVLVSAINPTKAGEGKTTTSVGLAMGLAKLGQKSVACLREPSLGPVFGIKGGGTGGGVAQIEPAADINLHFTGDIHAIGSAHNLLAAIVDNDLHFGSKSGLDPRRTTWGRVLDMNDRALRNVMVGLGGRTQGMPRESGFDITAASEIMAVLGLAKDFDDLRDRLGRIVVGRRHDRTPVTAADLKAENAMAALLKDALMPNLAQTREGTPALIHGGPFANIAHGCSSVIATEMGLRYADIVVTEAGFGFDLGAEKFLHIKARQAGLWPDALVMVATLRALKVHGGCSLEDSGKPNAEALRAGLGNLDKHLDAAAELGLSPVVAINAFPTDTDEEFAMLREHVEKRGVRCALSKAFADGGEGAKELAEAVLEATEKPSEANFLYDLDASYEEKLNALAKTIYGADGVDIEAPAKRVFKRLEKEGQRLPICVAKTPLSISDNPKMLGRPSGFRIRVRDARHAAGAGFVVALLGDVMTMPGLPRVPAAAGVRIEDGKIRGLMQND